VPTTAIFSRPYSRAASLIVDTTGLDGVLGAGGRDDLVLGRRDGGLGQPGGLALAGDEGTVDDALLERVAEQRGYDAAILGDPGDLSVLSLEGHDFLVSSE